MKFSYLVLAALFLLGTGVYAKDAAQADLEQDEREMDLLEGKNDEPSMPGPNADPTATPGKTAGKSLLDDVFELQKQTREAIPAGPMGEVWVDLMGGPNFHKKVQRERTGKDGAVLFKRVERGHYRLVTNYKFKGKNGKDYWNKDELEYINMGKPVDLTVTLVKKQGIEPKLSYKEMREEKVSKDPFLADLDAEFKARMRNWMLMPTLVKREARPLNDIELDYFIGRLDGADKPSEAIGAQQRAQILASLKAEKESRQKRKK